MFWEQLVRRDRPNLLRKSARHQPWILEQLEDRVTPATITVTGTGDTVVVDGLVTLREAITSINNGSNVNADVAAVGAYGTNDTIAFNIPGAGVQTINVLSALPNLSRAVTIDGTTQSTNTGFVNPAALGAGGTVGVGPDGVAGTADDLALPTFDAPEVEIRGTNAVASGLTIAAGNVTVRGLAIFGFGAANINIAQNSNNLRIEQNVVGTTATSFTDPGAGVRSGGANIRAAAGGLNGGTVRNNLVGFAAGRGIQFSGQAGSFQITGNEVRGNGATDPTADGIDLTGDTTQFVVRGNLVVGNGGFGIDLTRAGGGGSNATVDQNTISGNGTGGAQTAGIATGGPDNRITRNLISTNTGAGVLVNSNSQRNTISLNSIFDNGTIGIDLLAPTDNQNTGTAPYVTLNKPAGTGTGGNELLNFPVLETATISAGFLQLSGFTINPSGVVIELFVSDGDPSGFGEGRTYLITLTEGSNGSTGPEDLDRTAGNYGPGPINGLAQGSGANAQRFRFLVPLASLPGVTAGTVLTATGTQANRTSEFSGQVTVVDPVPEPDPVALTGTVFEDVNYGGGPGRSQGDSAGAGRPGVRVELYGAGGNFIGFATTDADGRYTFTDVPRDSAYSVRVVNDTVTSARPGATAGLFAVQTYRTDVSLGRTAPVGEVGGAVPSMQDSPANTTGADLGAIPVAQSVTRVGIPVGKTSVTGLDFGFNFDTIVNTNDAGQGSLRQFIVNSNALANTGLDQADTRTVIPAGAEASIFMIPLPGVQTISPTSALPPVTDSATWIDGFIQPGSAFGAPLVELNGAAAGVSDGLALSSSSNDLIRGLVINRFGGAGVSITGGSGNRVQANFVGTDPTGTAARGNGSGGVLIAGATNTLVGSDNDGTNDAAEGNVLAFNGGAGVAVTGNAAVGNIISRNSHFSNTGLGIDLANDGVTLNDPGDTDTGPNNLFNFPVFTTAELSGGSLVLSGFARPGSAIELFVADPDPTGFGEGRTYLVTRGEGSADDLDPTTGSYGPTVNGLNVGTDTTNRFRFVIPLALLPGVAVGTVLTATATSPNPSTSEFSGVVVVTLAPTPPVPVVPVTPVTPPMPPGLIDKSLFLSSTPGLAGLFLPTSPQFVNSMARLGTASSVRSSGVAVGSDAGQVGVARLFDFATATERVTVVPFGGFLGGVRVAAGDVNGDGIDDLVTTMGPGGLPIVLVFDGTTGGLISGFFALPPGYTGGLSVAAGDVNGDGRAEVVVGASTGVPIVAAYDGLSGTALTAFLAFGGFPVGVNVAAGDVNGDGRADIVAGAAGGLPMVFVYDGATGGQLSAFFAFPPALGTGVNVAVATTGAGGAQVVATPASGPVPLVATFGLDGTMTASALAPNSGNGLRVGTADINGDGASDLVLGGGHGGTRVNILSGRDFALLDDFYAFAPFGGTGVFVG